MPLLQVIVLALVQGLTEFLPISSTAHLYLTSWLFGWQVEGLDFDIALHIGTLLAVLLYFARDWLQILAQGFGIRTRGDDELTHNHMMLWLLVIGTIPVGLAGLVFNKQAETTWRNPFVIGGMLIAVGILMYFAENAGRKQRDLSSINLPDAMTIGAAQALAVVPGTSRSGITISAGLFRNMTRESAARFSFLLSTPAIGAAAAKALYDMHKNGRPARGSEYRLSGRSRGERDYRLPRDLLVSALFASRRLAAVRVLPDCFWHNSPCSGFHPPASVMKLLSPTQHRRLNEIVGFLLLSLGLVMLIESDFVPYPGPVVRYGFRCASPEPCRLPGLLSLRSVFPDVRRGGVSVPAADVPALLEVDSQRGVGGRRRQDFRLDPADARPQRRDFRSCRSACSAATYASAARSV